MIYTTGDSHADWTYHDIPGCVVHSVSMITMHRVGRMDDNLIPDYVASLPLTPSDTLILACGEIDCRCHIKGQTERRGLSVEAITLELAENYLERAVTLPLRGARVAITSVPPPIPAGTVYYAGVILPVEGSNEERADYTTTLNRQIASACEKRGVPFIDVYTPYADANGLIRTEDSDGSVHIRNTTHVRTALLRLGLIH